MLSANFVYNIPVIVKLNPRVKSGATEQELWDDAPMARRYQLILWCCTVLAAVPIANRANAMVGVIFTDIAGDAGITFRHDNAATREKYLIETMGAGCAWIDFNQDGLLDLYLVNSAATAAYDPTRPLRSALYRNNGDGTF